MTNHVVPGMWEVEGLSNAAAASYRWWRDLLGDRELAAQSSSGSAYETLNALAAQTAPPQSISTAISGVWGTTLLTDTKSNARS